MEPSKVGIADVKTTVPAPAGQTTQPAQFVHFSTIPIAQIPPVVPAVQFTQRPLAQVTHLPPPRAVQFILRPPATITSETRTIVPSTRTGSTRPTIPGSKTPEKIRPEKIPEPLQLNIPPERHKSPVVRQKMKQNPKIYILYKVVTNILSLLRKRGYEIPNEFDDLNNLTPNKFILTYLRKAQIYNSQHPGEEITLRKYLSRDFYRGDLNNREIIHVNYPETPIDSGTTTKSQIDHLIDILGRRMNSQNYLNPAIYHVMIVSELPLSPQARTSLKNYQAIKFELYTYSEISFLASQHFLVPEHRALTQDEVGDIIKSGIAISTLKTIANDDPIIREYGFSVDDIIEITRYNYLYLHPIIVTIEYRIVSRRLMIPKK